MTMRDISRRLDRLDTGRSIEPVEFIVLRGVRPRAAARLALGELELSEADDTTSYIMRMEVDPNDQPAHLESSARSAGLCPPHR